MILDRIIETKKKEIAQIKTIRPLAELKRMVRDLQPARDFRTALTSTDCAIIAEIKRRSPSKGTLAADFNVSEIAQIYEKNGAAAISVLTDRDFFAGEGAYIEDAKQVSSLPVLRKDFIIDPYQIYETKVLGGDALLLIASLFDGKALAELIALSESLGLSALVEVHTEEETSRAVAAEAGIIGINNRNLQTFTTDIGRSLALAPLIPKDRVAVSESGIHKRSDIEQLMKAGLQAFLVGEALMRAGDMGEKLRELKGQ